MRENDDDILDHLWYLKKLKKWFWVEEIYFLEKR